MKYFKKTNSLKKGEGVRLLKFEGGPGPQSRCPGSWGPSLTFTPCQETPLLRYLVKFEFIIGIITLHRLPHSIRAITQKLQGRAIVIISTYQVINEIINSKEFL